MKVLLVDDEPGIREGLAALLRRKGHEVHTAGDCAAAAAMLVAHPFDVVVTDWRLPDGTASTFVGDCQCPVVAVSGHPEEVERHAAVQEVLTKPVSPSRLLEVLTATRADAVTAVIAPLPLDVARIVAQARLWLEPAGAVDVQDDGTFVTLRAPVGDEAVLARLESLGGDLRVLARDGRPRVELRLCRDGRPDAGLPAVDPHVDWPDVDELAVDFDGIAVSAVEFAACLDRVRDRRARGACVHFLNLPDSLRSWASDQGRAHDMPMREKVGPRLPAVLAALWS